MFSKIKFDIEKSSILLIKSEKLKKGSSDKIIKKHINPCLPEINISQIFNICENIKTRIGEIKTVDCLTNFSLLKFKGQLTSTLTGHSSYINSFILLKYGRIASGSWDKTIKIWDTNNYSCLSTLSGHSDRIYSLIVLPDGRLASGSADSTIKIWDTNNYSCLSTLTGHSDRIYSLIVLPDERLASGSADKTIKIWDTNNNSCLSTLTEHSRAIYSLIVLPDGRLASGSCDNTIKIWI